MTDALKKSEDFQIEQAMLDDKLKASDWEATNEEIMELVAQESYLQWLKDNEKRSVGDGGTGDHDVASAANATCSSWSHMEARPPKSSPSTSSSSSKKSPLLGATASTSASHDDDSDILAQVLAASQQEYLDSLKAKRHHQQNRNS